ncbi:ROK family protein [Metabacillus herbersteinensis]|uniref:ROK family protein n=1 Tax=Metabacillus herbersteinensis TaxID=283816 RepID=A0ABV6GGM0_9BACI
MNTIGIDLGGTNLRVGVIAKNGEILEQYSRPTEAEKGPEFAINTMTELIDKLRANHEVSAIGIGSPGPLNPLTGMIIEPPNLPGFLNVPIKSIVEEKTGLTVTLENDANAAALAEAKIGAGKNAASVFYITLSTGIGGGLVINGNLFSGAQGNCGEIGNMIIDPSGHESPGLNKGALEALASGTAIGRMGFEQLGITTGAQGVFQLAESGHTQAQNIIDKALTYLAMGIANIVHTLNPEVIILGGGMMKSKDLIFVPLEDKTRDYLYPSLKDSFVLKPALLDQKAGLIGAGFLPR